MRAFLHIIIPVIILGLGFWGFEGTQKLKKNAFKLKKSTHAEQKKRPTIKTKASPLTLTNYKINLTTQGTIRAYDTTTLTSQVSGKIISISPQFEDGAFFNKGDILLSIDKADYLTDLESTKAQLARAEASYAQEKARAKQAQLNWNDAGFKEKASDLVLRKPQLREAEANVNANKSALKKAKRNLQRTEVRAPYNGRVRKRNIGLGQQVSGSSALGEIFSTDFAKVRMPLKAKNLIYYTPPKQISQNKTENNISFTSPLSKGKISPPTWKGNILRTEGELDEKSKQIFIIARIQDPFSLKSDYPPLYIGQPVHASIPAKELQGVYLIPRKSLSDLNEITVVRDGKIKRISFQTLWSASDYLVISPEGIETEDLLCTSSLLHASEGAPVVIIN